MNFSPRAALLAALSSILLAACSAGPREVPLGSLPVEKRYQHARDATLLLFPNLEALERESGWIVSRPRYIGGIDRRRLRAYVHVFERNADGPRAEIWVEREVFASKWLFGLLGSEGWTLDGRDTEFEERLAEHMNPTRTGAR